MTVGSRNNRKIIFYLLIFIAYPMTEIYYSYNVLARFGQQSTYLRQQVSSTASSDHADDALESLQKKKKRQPGVVEELAVHETLPAVVTDPLKPALVEIYPPIGDALLTENQWSFPEIDIVYTWVNGSDPTWQKEKEKARVEFLSKMMGLAVENSSKDTVLSNGDNRYRTHGELKYSLRSVEKYARFVRKIHLVVADGQIPSWLNLSHPMLNVVYHSEIFQNKSHLPTFGSVAIESNLDNIPNLADYYLYLNDDTFFGKNVSPADFFVTKYSGQQRVFEETWAPHRQCSPGCSVRSIANGRCDSKCNKAECGWDFGDCGLAVLRKGKEQLRKERRSGRKFKPGSGEFITTLIYVDGVFNRELRPPKRQRNVIRHVPHLFSKKMMKDLKKRFPDEFEWTSEHKMRHPEDMQLAFSYFHYLKAVRVYAPTRQQAWRAALLTVDDKDFLLGSTNKIDDAEEIKRAERVRNSKNYDTVRQCAVAFHHVRAQSSEFSASCQEAMTDLLENFDLRLPYRKSETGSPREVEFRILYDKGDGADAVKQLNLVATCKKKFITINDDMSRIYPQVESAYERMYLAHVPNRSKFEKSN